MSAVTKPANPGSDVTFTLCATEPEKRPQIGASAYTLSGHGLVSTIVGSCERPLWAYRIRTPQAVRKRTCGVVVAGMQAIP